MLARSVIFGGLRREDGARPRFRGDWRARFVWLRQSHRDGAGQRLAAMADGSDHAVLEKPLPRANGSQTRPL
jgi:hypothetical protein